MLNQLRVSAGGYAAKFLMALLVLSFAVWGIGDMVTNRSGNSTLAKVGGEKITVVDFERALQRETENLRRSLGAQYSPELLRNFNLPEIVLRREINARLLKQDSQDRGIVPSDTDIVRRIKTNPAFAGANGSFDKDRFNAVLRAGGQSEKNYVEQMRGELAGVLIMDNIASVASVPEKAAATIAQALGQQRTALFYTLSTGNIAAPTPKGDELETYYKEHAGEFSTQELRSASYVVLTQDDIRSKAMVSPEDLQAAYNERITEFKRPERRTVEQLLFSSEENAKKAQDLAKSGKDFAAIAKQMDILNKGSISLGTVERGHILEGAEEAVFSLQKGGVTDLIKSPFGVHLFHVSKIEPEATASLDEVKPKLEKELLQSSYEQAISNFTNQLQDMLAGGSSLQEAAKELGLKVKSVGAVTAEGKTESGQKAELPDLDKFVETLYKTDEKSESSLVMSKGGKYYILRTDAITPSRVLPLEEVRTRVLSGWQRQQQSAQLADMANDAEKMFADEKTRPAAINKFHLQPAGTATVKRQGGKLGDKDLPQMLVDQIFARNIGEATPAFAIGDNSYAIAVVQNITPATTPAEKNSEEMVQIKKTLETRMQDELLEQYMRRLAEKYTVKVDQSLFDSLSKNADK